MLLTCPWQLICSLWPVKSWMLRCGVVLQVERSLLKLEPEVIPFEIRASPVPPTHTVLEEINFKISNDKDF